MAASPDETWWIDLPKEELLDVRLSDLGVSIEGSILEDRIEGLRGELEGAGLRFRPYTWLSTDWFTPHGVTGFAIPFYLAHPRLVRLERQMMFEVEGASRSHCMKLLRHETGHALDNAYHLSRRRGWRRRFGKKSEPYWATYVPRPYSHRYVLHLDNWYAQSHPIEDFAETFAVWMAPRSGWRSRYEGWPALRKLEFVDELMQEIGSLPPRLRTRERVDSLPRLRFTLRDYYRRKQARYGHEDRSIYDRDLKRLFSDDGHRRLASSFLRERRSKLRRQVANWTGQHQFVVDEVLRHMIVRSRDLKLRLKHNERETGEGAAILVTAHSTRLLRMRHRIYFR